MQSVSSDERWLVARARQRDRAAFEVLVERHAQYVYNLAMRVLHQPQEAEDLAQEAFLRAWIGLANFRGDAAFSTWLYRIVTNLCFNHLPRMRDDLAALDPGDEAMDLPDERQNVEAAYLSEELRRSLHRAIDELPAAYRLLLTLRHLQQLSYQEIASVTGMPLGTVKTGIHRARRTLQAALETKEVEP